MSHGRVHELFGGARRRRTAGAVGGLAAALAVVAWVVADAGASHTAGAPATVSPTTTASAPRTPSDPTTTYYATSVAPTPDPGSGSDAATETDPQPPPRVPCPVAPGGEPVGATAVVYVPGCGLQRRSLDAGAFAGYVSAHGAFEVRDGVGLAKGSATSAYTVTSEGELFYATTDSATYGNCGPVTMHHQSAGRDVATWNPLVGSEARDATTAGYALREVTATQDRVGWYGAPCTDPEDGTNYGLLHLAATDGSHRIDVSPGDHFVSSMALSDDGRLAVAVAVGQSQQNPPAGWFVSVSAAPTANGTLSMQQTMRGGNGCRIADMRWHGTDLVLLESCPQADTVTSRVSVLVYTGPAFAARTVTRLSDTKLGMVRLLQPSDGSIVVRESSTDVINPQPDVYAVLADATHVRRFTVPR